MIQSSYIDKWPQAMLLGLRHYNLSTTLHKLFAISDEICFQAGDRSTDSSWYVQRSMLLKVYCLTEIHMLADKSENFEDTWSFLDRRLAEMSAAQ